MDNQKSDLEIVIEGAVSQEHLILFEKAVEILQQNNLNALRIILNSPGGDANVGVKIINTINSLSSKGVEILTHGINLVGSAALGIYIYGTKRSLEANTSVVIDLPYKLYDKKLILGFAQTEAELLRLIEENKNIQLGRQQWAEMFANILNQPVENIYKLEGKYITTEEALKLGFCQSIVD